MTAALHLNYFLSHSHTRSHAHARAFFPLCAEHIAVDSKNFREYHNASADFFKCQGSKWFSDFREECNLDPSKIYCRALDPIQDRLIHSAL